MNQQEQMYAMAEQWRESGGPKSKFCRDQDISLPPIQLLAKKVQ